MSKRRRERETASTVAPAGADKEPPPSATTPTKTGWKRYPIWGWALIFILPLLLSEYMFYMAGRPASMVLFPIAWAGFWGTIWFRSKAQPHK